MVSCAVYFFDVSVCVCWVCGTLDGSTVPIPVSTHAPAHALDQGVCVCVVTGHSSVCGYSVMYIGLKTDTTLRTVPTSGKSMGMKEKEKAGAAKGKQPKSVPGGGGKLAGKNKGLAIGVCLMYNVLHSMYSYGAIVAYSIELTLLLLTMY